MPGYMSRPREASRWGPVYNPFRHLVVSPQSLADPTAFFPLFFLSSGSYFIVLVIKEIWKGRKQ